VADLRTVWVEIGIYPKDLYRVKEGQMVEVVVPVENKGSQARLIYVSPIVADETITAKAVAELDNPQGIWRPGVFVKVNIATEKISLPLVIPKEAVQNSDGRDFVFIVTAEGFEKRFIKLGQSDNENVEVLSGLNPGEQYVANKTFLLKAELGKSGAEHEH
jgi:membrane fusion protein, heavy metal efflux system